MTVTTKAGLKKVVKIMLASGKRKFFLTGDLGAGKTTLVQAFCKALGVREAVVSPTFALVNEYSYLDDLGREQLVRHLDLYRLHHLAEVMAIGAADYLFDAHYCLVEWPELLEAYASEPVQRIKLELLPSGDRKILFL